jgi:hypothetical protein
MADRPNKGPPPKKDDRRAANTTVHLEDKGKWNGQKNSTTVHPPAMELSPAERKFLLQLAREIATGGALASYCSYVGVGEQVCEALRYSRRIDPNLIMELFHYRERATALREALRASSTASPSAAMLGEELREVDNA